MLRFQWQSYKKFLPPMGLYASVKPSVRQSVKVIKEREKKDPSSHNKLLHTLRDVWSKFVKIFDKYEKIVFYLTVLNRASSNLSGSGWVASTTSSSCIIISAPMTVYIEIFNLKHKAHQVTFTLSFGTWISMEASGVSMHSESSNGDRNLTPSSVISASLRRLTIYENSYLVRFWVTWQAKNGDTNANADLRWHKNTKKLGKRGADG